MTRVMYDAVTPENVPRDAQMVAGYIDGRFAWSAAQWAYFPNSVKVRIACFASTNDGQVLDCEWGDATPQQCPGWAVQARARGQEPTIYCSFSTWPTVRAAFAAAGVAEPQWWIAAYPGNGPYLYPGSVAHQYANPGPVDISVVADYWPGVDNSTQGVPDMDATQAKQLAYIAKIVGLALDTGGQIIQGEALDRIRQIDQHTVAPSPSADTIATATAAKVNAVNADAVAAAIVAKLTWTPAPTKEEVAIAVHDYFVANPLSLH
jgi:hypothetical protein